MVQQQAEVIVLKQFCGSSAAHSALQAQMLR
jgi:hypothetical protein